MAMTKSKTKLVTVARKTSVPRSVIKNAVLKAFADRPDENEASIVLEQADKNVAKKQQRKIVITRSKTKLIKVDRKFSVKRSVVEKIVDDMFAAQGIAHPKRRKAIKL